MPRPSSNADTAQRIMDIAEGLLQTRGYNAFSYADIAHSLRVTKASLHYHFPTKAELGQRLIQRYRNSFLKALEQIDQSGDDSRERVRRYICLYLDVLRNKRMCLCGMLAAEYTTLPEPMQAELKRFFDENERWLVGVLEEGSATGKLRFDGTACEMARLLMSSLEGAMMLARSYNDIARFESTADRVLSTLTAGKEPSHGRARHRAPGT